MTDSDRFFSADQFQTFFKPSNQSLIIKASDESFQILAVSDGFLILVHKNRNELIGRCLFDVFPKSTKDLAGIPNLYDSFMRVISSRKLDELPMYKCERFVPELQMHKTCFYTALNEPLRDKLGSVEYIISTITDVTDQQMAQEATRTMSDEVLRIATEFAGLGTWHYDHTTGDFQTSTTFKEIFGFSTDEQPSYESVMLQVIESDRQRLKDALSSTPLKEVTFNIEFQILVKKNQIRWLRSVGKAVREDKGSNCTTGILTDVTEQRNEDQRKNDFIAMVSHELKTPITSLNGYIQSVQRRLTKRGDNFQDDFTQLLLNKANAQIGKMTTLINDFLNVSRLESGQIRIDKQPFDIAGLLKEIEEECIETISSHRIDFLTDTEIMVTADRDKIGHVIHNLISNAVKYSLPNSVVSVSCQLTGNEVIVCVQDEGIGVPLTEIPKIFDRYYRMDTHNNSISGFGIGLYLCKEIIRLHGFRIWINSGQVKGSTFCISLACTAA